MRSRAASAQQPPPVCHPQRRHGARRAPAVGLARRGARCRGAAAGDTRHRLGVPGPGTDRGEQFGPHLLRRWRGQVVGAGQHPPVAGVPGQVVPERRAGPEHGRQPAAQPGVLRQRPRQFRVARQPGQRGQRQIGVRGGAQRIDQGILRLAPVHGQVPDEQFRPRRVREAQPGQPCGGGGLARHAHPSTVTARLLVAQGWADRTPVAMARATTWAATASTASAGAGTVPVARQNMVSPS